MNLRLKKQNKEGEDQKALTFPGQCVKREGTCSEVAIDRPGKKFFKEN